MKQWTKNYMKSISEIEKQDAKLTPHERGFVSFLKRQVENEIAVSSHQSRSLEKIWKKVCK